MYSSPMGSGSEGLRTWSTRIALPLAFASSIALANAVREADEKSVGCTMSLAIAAEELQEPRRGYAAEIWHWTAALQRKPGLRRGTNASAGGNPGAATPPVAPPHHGDCEPHRWLTGDFPVLWISTIMAARLQAVFEGGREAR